MASLPYNRFVLAKDNFYADPSAVLKAATACEYFEPEDVTGFRSTTVYHEPGVKSKLEKILGIKITRWDTDPKEENGVFYQGFSKGKRREVPGVHADFPNDDITVLIYLTPGLPIECGTSLWQHKRTGLTDYPKAEDSRRLKMKLSDLKEELENDTKDRLKWIELDRMGYGFNRMVAYPSGVFHSATNHYGSDITNGRLYQTFRIGVDWGSFRMQFA
jgi:Family of unknown function (DUF6445)